MAAQWAFTEGVREESGSSGEESRCHASVACILWLASKKHDIQRGRGIGGGLTAVSKNTAGFRKK